MIFRLLAAIAAGLALYASFPPVGLWWTAPLGAALLTGALAPIGRGSAGPVRGPRMRGGALIGFVAGLAFFLPLLPFVGLYVGAYAWIALSIVEALYLAAFGAGAALLLSLLTSSRDSRDVGPSRDLGAGRDLDTARELETGRELGSGRERSGVRGWSRALLALGIALALAAWWVLWEWIRGSWPFGGFPWGRLAFGQADGPLLPAAAIGGAPLLSFVVVAAGAGLALATLWVFGGSSQRSFAPVPLGAVVVAAALALLGASPLAAPNTGDEAGADRFRVAVIQGNVPTLGLDFSAQRAAVLQNHLDETRRLAERIEAGEVERPDLVLWAENASDISPLANAAAGRAISEAARHVGAPISFGTVLRVGDGPEATNTQLVWDAEQGVVDRHDKQYLQPFGEWLPWRGLFEALFPIAERAGHFVPGEAGSDGVVQAAGAEIGVATCYEVAYDAAAREPLARGAQVLTVPTNNATFGESPMTYQQLAMSRVRAVEHHVPVLIAATSGVSAVIDRDGTVEAETGIFEAATLHADLRLGGAGTIATRAGGWIELAVCLLGLAAVLGAGAVALRGRGGRGRYASPDGAPGNSAAAVDSGGVATEDARGEDSTEVGEK